ncbi:MAG: 4-hydroxythreonine-4-phosphate dehydrogenase PdxA [Planctomycetota bacterium]
MSVPRNAKPRLAITVGDVAGVGPEVALKAAMEPEITHRCQPILVGPANAIGEIASRLKLSLPPMIDASAAIEGLGPTREMAGLVDVGPVALDTLVPGTFSSQTGRASFDAVDWAIRETMAGRFDAIVTGPIQKEAWHEAGTGYLGHTELLADRTATPDVSMMLTGPEVSSVLCTIHLPLADAIEALTIELIERAIRLGGAAMETRHGRAPRITVLGLNPHAGESGLLSRGEEDALIVPAIERVRQSKYANDRGWQIVGPVPPDTAFTPAMRRQTDVHVCMYHDQGLIPLKALSFDDAVNVTLGLPIVRTSVDHGTALDLAWQGVANHSSMRAAIEMAIDLCGVKS